VSDEYLQLKPVLTKDEYNYDWFLADEGFIRNREYDIEPPLEEELDNRELAKQIRSPYIAIKKYAAVRRIPCDEVDRSVRDDNFEYFRIDSGMNINVPAGKIKELRFILNLFADGKQSRDAFAISGFPDTEVERVNIIDGKIGLSINNLLKIIPHPVTQVIGNIVKIDLNPWDIKWGYSRMHVSFGGSLTDKLVWNLFEDNINKSFDCYITLQKKKTVKEVMAKAYAAWKYEPYGESFKERFARRFRRSYAPVRTDELQIEIIKSRRS
jgi:hypothetical protein